MRHNLLDDLAIVNHSIWTQSAIRFRKSILQPFKAPDCVLVLDVKGVNFGSDPLFAILIVDDVGPGGEEFADFDVVDGCDVQP